MSRWRRSWRELCAERGSQALEAAGAALAAALIVLALLNVAPLFGATVAQAFECAASVLLGGGGDCGGSAEVADTPGNSSTPASQPQNCGALCQVGGFFKGFVEGGRDMVVGLWDLGSDAVKAALGDEATRAKYAQLWDAIRTDPGGTLLAMGQAIVAPVVEDWHQGRYGEAIGRGLFEGLSVVVGPKGANKVGTLGKVDDLARAGDRLANGQRVIRRLPCTSFVPSGKGPGLAKPLANDCARVLSQLDNATIEAVEQARAAERTVSSAPAAQGRPTLAEANGQRTHSGWELRDGYIQRTDAVQQRGDDIGYRFPRAGYLDQGQPGRYYASHAEKQAFEAAPHTPIGVSKPMCNDCRNYFRELATQTQTRQIVADPDNVRIFNPDGSVDVIRPDNSITRYPPNTPVKDLN